MATVSSAAQDLWVALNQVLVSDPLVLPLLTLLAVFFGVVFGLLVGGRVARRANVLRFATQPKPAVVESPVEEPDAAPGEPQWDDLRRVLEEHADEATAFLGERGLLPMPPSAQAMRWRDEILAAYVGDEVLSKLSASAQEGQAGGSVELAQAVRGSILFFDLRGFTQATEHLGGAYVMRLLNVYLRQMGEVVAAHDGIVDKFIGDNVMATFGVLRPVQNAAQSAAACAQGMIERMEDINKQLKERGLPSLRPSVGLASGEMVAGTLGGSKRRSFTVIGACVNRASRLENATRDLGVDLLMDRSSYDQLSDPPWGMKVHHRVELRGVDEAILAWSWTRPRVTEPSA